MTAAQRDIGDCSSAWISHAVLPYGLTGFAVFGAITSIAWFPIAYLLGKRYETVRAGEFVSRGRTRSHGQSIRLYRYPSAGADGGNGEMRVG